VGRTSPVSSFSPVFTFSTRPRAIQVRHSGEWTHRRPPLEWSRTHPFVRQVQLSCDHAKFAPARLTGKEAPKHPDDEQTIDALHARIRSVRSWIDGFGAGDFAGAEKIVVTLPRWEGKGLTGEDYLLEYALPNFYFHVTHTYAILRHNGLDLGKKDYVGSLSLRAP
jgi:hypothetical protein